MRNYWVLLLISASALNGQAISDPMSGKAEGEVRKVLDDLAEARNVRNAKGIAAAFAEDGVYTTTGGNILNGRTAIENSWAALFNVNTDARTIRTVHRIRFINANLAVADSTVSTMGFPQTGNPNLIDIYVLTRKGEQWQITEAWTCFADRWKS